MSKVDLSAKELIKLMRACRANGVTELSFGDIRLVIERQTKVASETPAVIQTTEADQAKVENLANESRVKDEIEMREEQLQFMQIENPALYEQLLIERDLTNDSGQSAAN